MVWSLQMMGKVTNAMGLVLMELGFKEVCLQTASKFSTTLRYFSEVPTETEMIL